MKLDLKKDLKISHKWMLIISGVVGVIWFAIWYGLECVDFTNVNWIYNSYNDVVQHYMGWVYYRNSDWAFPLGVFKGLTSDYDNSIVYSDSIPLFAIIFKVFRGILPEIFQYLGLFSLLSVVLQSICSSELIYRLTGKVDVSLISSVFFLSATILSRRLFEHTSLTFHVIILIGLMLFLETRDEKKKNMYVKWNLLLVLSVLIHAYYLPMVFALELFYYIKESKLKDTFGVVVKIAGSIIITLVVMYLVGYFVGAEYAVEGNTLGLYGTSLNALVYGQGYSLIDILFGNINTVWSLEEGYAYLGLGAILLVGIALFYCIKSYKKLQYKQAILCVSLIVIFIVVSMIPVIRWNWDKVILVPIPSLVKKILGIFRSNGRFIWPAFYLLLVCSSYMIVKRAKYSQIILLVCATVQLIDLAPYYILQSSVVEDRVKTKFSSELVSYVPTECDYVMLMDEPNSESGFDYEQTFLIGDFAVDRRAELSDFYMARKDESVLAYDREKTEAAINNNILEADYVYVYASVPYENMINCDRAYYYSLDGIICATGKKIDGREELDIHKGINLMSLIDSAFINVNTLEGISVDKNMENITLERDYMLYTRDVLPKGTFMINLAGENLQAIKTIVEGDGCLFEILEMDDTHILVEVRVEEESMVHFQYLNNGDEASVIEKLMIYD